MSVSARQRDLFVATLSSAAVVVGVVWLVTRPLAWFSVLWVAVAATVVGTSLRRGLAPTTGDRRPTRPRPARRAPRVMAVVSALFAAVLLAVFLPRFARDGQPPALLALWALFAVAIAGFNLWTAFRGPAQAHDERVTPAAPPPR
ncbi:hypothetical protein [Micromonospora humi]|uniref:Uncharacterized protein n=1 Tax=Micromonospora humi TaxID=745366 RepID=A0A1C5J2L6_9ACTN|nr:hypothetical protein [Micromonospora humi]SCG64429.1 hypothetical protein GA0070213_10895 [Micromonospora humi]